MWVAAAPMKSVIKRVVVVILVVQVQLMGVSMAATCTCQNVSVCVDYFQQKWNTSAFNKCCGGIKTLRAACNNASSVDRQRVCSCIQKALGRHNIKISDIKSLLSKCHINYAIPSNCANFSYYLLFALSATVILLGNSSVRY
ncbi:hypothetical protein RJ641_035816 [Dillenia turbinata]|uniref:Bifunctional inhibitor/plant lipid transfer protein/seed storage helical domain-containing protein n=1 Tax=Dillenia turbinata TaxID=194707 RepID=A0AAN8VT45_9MAGN